MTEETDDQHMSSPDVDSEEVMFPSDAPPLQPELGMDSRLGAARELSPPNSQESVSAPGPGDMQSMPRSSDAMEITSSDPLEKGDAETREEAEDKPREKENGNKVDPSWPWTTRKAQEEYMRIMETILDDNWSMADLGDPFDESRKIVGG